jgi:hypothetical protein
MGAFFPPAPLLRALEALQAYEPVAGSGGFLLGADADRRPADQPLLSNPPFALQEERA